MTALLDIAAISCRYGERVVCEGLSLAVSQGDIACLLGPSGCGKTTVLRAVAGFEPVYAGRIALGGRELSRAGFTLAPELRSVGLVFQDYALFPHLTVAQNIAFGLHKHSTDERRRITQHMLELTRLTDYADVWPQQLSGGQQQRVALARALAPQPQLLLLDEPFSNLDTELRRTLCEEVRTLLKAQGTTAILVTHDQTEAFTMADCIGVMAAGNVLQWGTARELYEAPATPAVARFIGQGQLLPGRIEGNRLQCALGTLDLSASALAGYGRTRPLASLDSYSVELLLRPWNLQPGDETCVRGRVVAHSFQGAYTITSLALPDGTTIHSQHEGFAGLPVGAETPVALVADRLNVYPTC
jgi:iron(III) transport system ATP-binding protein